MKILIRKISLFVIMGLLIGAFSSFSIPTKDHEITLRNIEALSRGEETTTPTCIHDQGRCIINNVLKKGMTVKP